MAKKEVPKYIQKLLLRRWKLAADLIQVDSTITEYCEKIGIGLDNPNACLLSDVRIYCEPENAYKDTLDEIERVLNLEGKP